MQRNVNLVRSYLKVNQCRIDLKTRWFGMSLPLTFKSLSTILNENESYWFSSVTQRTRYFIYCDGKGHPRAYFNMAADLTCEGCNFFRQRLVLATLSDKSVKMKNIRAVEDDPGLKGASVIELILEITAFSAANFSCT